MENQKQRLDFVEQILALVYQNIIEPMQLILVSFHFFVYCVRVLLLDNIN